MADDAIRETPSGQDLEDMLEATFSRLIRLLTLAEAETCAAAGTDSKGPYAQANAEITEALGLALQSKAAATRAGMALPDITVQFGGK